MGRWPLKLGEHGPSDRPGTAPPSRTDRDSIGFDSSMAPPLHRGAAARRPTVAGSRTRHDHRRRFCPADARSASRRRPCPLSASPAAGRQAGCELVSVPPTDTLPGVTGPELQHCSFQAHRNLHSSDSSGNGRWQLVHLFLSCQCLYQ